MLVVNRLDIYIYYFLRQASTINLTAALKSLVYRKLINRDNMILRSLESLIVKMIV